MHGNREILVLSASADRSEKVRTRTSDMYDTGEVGQAHSTKETGEQRGAAASAAESVEGRGLTKGNVLQATALRTQSQRVASIRLQCVRALHECTTLRHYPR